MKSLRSLAPVALALLAVFGLTACIQVDKLVKLKPDGSGTVEETVVMSKEMVAQMKQMSAGLSAFGGEKPADGAAAPAFSLMDEKKLRAAAEKMGEGVTFVSAKPVTTATGEGFTAIYAFTDISKLKVSQDMGDNLPQQGGSGVNVRSKSDSDPVTFQFAKGSPAMLTINTAQPKEADLAKAQKNQAAKPEGGEEMATMMMQQMLKDMKMSLVVEFAGAISQTNAEHVNGSRVTLMEMDFNKLLADPVKFKELSRAQPKTIQDARALMKGVDGIKAETQPKVTVKFQ